ncbi:hypothetical protein GCM10023189_01600 [Nibrella saemangeumensis]|uniref:DUF2911 domain-containing protein n=1 Tax=Nibrella saemangeumensis TaxID=1084526 RepID=A0ABP8M8N1_9BACT
MKRVLIIAGVVLIGLFLAFLLFRNFTKSASPEATAEIEQNGLHIKVAYSQPYKKGRKIFGGLVPYGEVWRTGANEATEIDFDQDVIVAGQPLDKGEYSLWSIPSQAGWIVIFNKETGQWGTDYDQTKDVLRVPVIARKREKPAEQFFISFAPQPQGTDMLLSWDDTEVVVPVRKRDK